MEHPLDQNAKRLFIPALELGFLAELAVFVLAHLFLAPFNNTTHRITSFAF
jgi:hypothetical protein